MDTNRYNTKVRQAMSNKYKETSKKKADLENELYLVSHQLSSNEAKNTKTYKEYLDLRQKAETIQREINRLSIEREIWNKAREICMDIADEEARKENANERRDTCC